MLDAYRAAAFGASGSMKSAPTTLSAIERQVGGSSDVSDLPVASAPWLTAPIHPVLRAGEPHVWRASLDLDAPRLAALHETLSADERARAARFHFGRDRNRFIAARGLLRKLLGLYLNRPPASLAFSYGARGKPYLAEFQLPTPRVSGALSTSFLPDNALGGAIPTYSELRFNISHSHGLGLFAFARGTELGIDVEQVRDDFASAEIAERFFSPRELAALRELPAVQRVEGFFNCWTRKEAYIKARGDGLSIPLDSFDVSLAPNDPPRLLDVRTENEPGPTDAGNPGNEAAHWSLHALAPAPGYAAALIVAGRAPSITLRLCAFA